MKTSTTSRTVKKMRKTCKISSRRLWQLKKGRAMAKTSTYFKSLRRSNKSHLRVLSKKIRKSNWSSKSSKLNNSKRPSFLVRAKTSTRCKLNLSHYRTIIRVTVTQSLKITCNSRLSNSWLTSCKVAVGTRAFSPVILRVLPRSRSVRALKHNMHCWDNSNRYIRSSNSTLNKAPWTFKRVD